jgi:hypothetical protein
MGAWVDMVLKSITAHITSSAFWRLVSLVLKRVFSIAKIILQQLPFFSVPLVYCLHFLRAFLRITDFLYKTKNKNLGETRKFIFALFKVIISLITLFFVFSGVSIPVVLFAAFFAYSLIKLADSTGVFIFSLIAYFKIDKSIENQWRKEHYKDNIKKHLSILAIGIAMTVATALFIAGASTLIWSSPLFIALLLSASAFSGISMIGFLSFISRNNRTKTPDVKSQKEHAAKLKLFFTLTLFGIASIILITLSPLFAISALGLLIALLNSLDAIKSIYDFFCSGRVPDPKPANLESKNSLIDSETNDYYSSKNRVLYLKIIENDEKYAQVVHDNKILAAKEGLVKILNLQYEIENEANTKQFPCYFFSQKTKLITKRDCLIAELAWVLQDEEKKVRESNLLSLLIEAISELYQDQQKLLLSRSYRDFSKKTWNNIKNMSWLEGRLAELIDTIPSLRNKKTYLESNNLLLNLFISYQTRNLPIDCAKPKAFYQSFRKKKGDCEDLSQFFKFCKKIEKNSDETASNASRLTQ